MPLSISFIVPAFNEEGNIEATVQTICQAIEDKQVDHEIILVDDASRDRTAEIIDALAAGNARVRALHNPVNLNLGGAYKHGLAIATKEFVIMVPGDNGYGVDSLNQILGNIGGADILIPYPTNIEARTRIRGFVSRAFTALINGLYGLNIQYYNGPVVHRTALLKTISIKTNSFAYQAEALVKMLCRGCSYNECPVQIQMRKGGRSSAMKLKNQVTVLTTLIHLLLVVGPGGVFAKKGGVAARSDPSSWHARF